MDHNQLRKILKERGILTTLPVSWEICMQVKKQESKPNMEQQTGSKQEKVYIKAVYCHPVYLIYMQSESESVCPLVVSNSLQSHGL